MHFLNLCFQNIQKLKFTFELIVTFLFFAPIIILFTHIKNNIILNRVLDTTAEELFNMFFGGGFPQQEFYVRRNGGGRWMRQPEAQTQHSHNQVCVQYENERDKIFYFKDVSFLGHLTKSVSILYSTCFCHYVLFLSIGITNKIYY